MAQWSIGGDNAPFFDYLPGKTDLGYFLGADSENHTHFFLKINIQPPTPMHQVGQNA